MLSKFFPNTLLVLAIETNALESIYLINFMICALSLRWAMINKTSDSEIGRAHV